MLFTAGIWSVLYMLVIACQLKYCHGSPVPETIEINNNQNTPPKVIQVSTPTQAKSSSSSKTPELTLTSSGAPDPKTVFNERRRDMYFDNYTLKQVEIIDTTKVNLTQFIADREMQKPQSGTAKSKDCITIEPNATSPVPDGLPVAPGNPIPALPVDQASNYLGQRNSSFVPASVNHDYEDALTSHGLRQNILVPKLDSGRPNCIESPDDTFCEIVDNYPKHIIRDEIGISPTQYNDLFGPKEIDGRKSYVDDHEADEESVCRKVPRVIYPQMAKNQANQWLYVVNEVEYTQAVVVDICERPGKACAHMDNLPPGMYSRCKQKFSYKRLLALHPTEKRTYPDTFKFPSCCSCYVKYVDDLLPRNSIGRTLQAKSDMTPVSSKPPKVKDQNDSESNSTTISTPSPVTLPIDSNSSANNTV